MVELLAPAGSYDSLRAAVNAGADAVYIGGSKFGARAYADNPIEEELLAGIDYCHIHKRKIYLTVNTLLKERELEESLYDYLLPYYLEGLDGVIVQDWGVMQYLTERFPKLPVHASTQMTVTGVDGARLLQNMGVTRVVTARELSLEEIRRIIDETQMEVETFIHGAMCYSYSGQCLFSSMIGGRSGNRGRCAQPCRLPYQLKDSAGARLSGQSCLLSMKDMCTLDILPELLDAGIASLKIEGRMKRPEYTAGVVSIYRKYIDRCLELGIGADSTGDKARAGCRIAEQDRRILLDLYNRGGFTDGYYKRHNGPEMMSMERPNHFGTPAAKITVGKKGAVKAVALEPLCPKDVLELHDGTLDFTLNASVRTGETVVLPKNAARLKNGSILYRTKCESLLRSLKEQYLDRNCKEKIKGALKILQGSPVILELRYGDIEVTVCGSQEVEAAQSQPTGRDAVEKQMRKTGNTPFEFESLEIDLEDGLFLPIKELNEVRRQGLEELEQKVLEAARRDGDAGEAVMDGERGLNAANVAPVCSEQNQNDTDRVGKGSAQPVGENGQPYLTVQVMTEEQLDAVLAFPDDTVAAVYLDLMTASAGTFRVDCAKLAKLRDRVREHGWKCYLNLSPVFRDRDRALLAGPEMRKVLGGFDGFLLHTVDELAYIREEAPGAELIADDTFYGYNRRAGAFLRGQGIDRLTLPAELNFRELQTLNTEGSELVVYGHQPLMHSAQCLVKNTGGCTAVPQLRYLKDRKNAEFPVWNRCVSCCNTIYNSVPLELAGCQAEIAALAPSSLRLSFTVESGEEAGEILADYAQIFCSAKGQRDERLPLRTENGTRGHFRRGVE